MGEKWRETSKRVLQGGSRQEVLDALVLKAGKKVPKAKAKAQAKGKALKSDKDDAELPKHLLFVSPPLFLLF